MPANTYYGRLGRWAMVFSPRATRLTFRDGHQITLYKQPSPRAALRTALRLRRKEQARG